MRLTHARFGLLGAAIGAATLGTALFGCGTTDGGKKEQPRAALKALRITEIHYHPVDAGLIPGDEFEFVEVKNTGSASLDLTDVGFTGGMTYTFPKGTSLEAGKLLVIAAFPDRFKLRYGGEALGPYEGQLKNSGESLVLEDLPAEAVIDSLTYSDKSPWPGAADGGGRSLVPPSPSDFTKPWRLSFRLNGSPGKDDIAGVLVNEVLSHTDLPDLDAIEFYNPEDAEVDIGGWWLSDDLDTPAKFRIPSGTKVPAKGYKLLDERDFNRDTTAANSFNFSENHDEAWLFADSSGCAEGHCHGLEFAAIENGLSVGRLVTSDGNEYFPIQSNKSLGAANAGPKAWPVVITEVMYHSQVDTVDFLEITNVSDKGVALFDTLRPANTWKVEGIGFKFPAGVTLAKGEAALVVPLGSDTARVRAAYGVPAAVRIFKADGELSNSGDSLALAKPQDPYLKDGAAPGDSTVPYMIMDQVYYLDGGPWPGGADGSGESLQRKSPAAFGSEPKNWNDSLPTAGR